MKIDMHCHTKYSHDALSSPYEIIRQAQKKGLDGVAITDHDTAKGWNDAILAAKKLNAQLILGEEIKSKNGDILGLFLKKEINMKGQEPEKIINEIHSQNGIAIIPHPFASKKPFKNLEQYLNIIDGIEIFNARRFFSIDNKKAKKFYNNHSNLCITAGSDCHYHKGVAYAYIESDAQNIEEFKNNILNKKNTYKGKKTPLFFLLTPTIKKIISKISV